MESVSKRLLEKVCFTNATLHTLHEGFQMAQTLGLLHTELEVKAQRIVNGAETEALGGYTS